MLSDGKGFIGAFQTQFCVIIYLQEDIQETDASGNYTAPHKITITIMVELFHILSQAK